MNNEGRDSYLSCPICQAKVSRDRRDSFCRIHQKALDNILESYREWVNAYGPLTKEEYLQLLVKNANSGDWVTEVANYLLKEGRAERFEFKNEKSSGR